MKYICIKPFDHAINPVVCNKGDVLETAEGYLIKNGMRVCYYRSQNARNHFAYDDDGKGNERYRKTQSFFARFAAIRNAYQAQLDEELSKMEIGEEGLTEEQSATLEAIPNKPYEFLQALSQSPYAKFDDGSRWTDELYFAGIEELNGLLALLERYE